MDMVSGGNYGHEDSALKAIVAAREVRANTAMTVLGLVVLTGTFAFVVFTFRSLVAPWLFWPWAAGYTALLAGLGMVMAIARNEKRDPDAAVRLWLPLAKALMLGVNLLTALSIWLLLPAAGPELRALMYVLYSWFLIVQIMATSQTADGTPVAIVVLLGSLILFELTRAGPHNLAIGGFLFLFGSALFGFRGLIKRALAQSIEAQALAEQRGAALSKAMHEVAAQRDAMTAFIASATHDLQQPVQAASLFFDQAVGSKQAATRARAILGARRAFAATEALLQAMLENLRVRSGAQVVRPVRLILGEIVDEVLAEQAEAANRADLRVRPVALGHEIVVDPIIFRRAMSNLVVNAIRHSGGSRLLIGARRHAGEVAIHVIDDGRGIDPKFAGMLFEDFARGATVAQDGSFGLGLSTARRLVRAMGGDLACIAKTARGAHFVLTLPSASIAQLPAPLAANDEEQCIAV